MKKTKILLRNLEKEKMRSIEIAMKMAMDNFYSNVSYLLQELELKNEISSGHVILKSKDDILEEMDKLIFQMFPIIIKINLIQSLYNYRYD